MNGPHPNNRKSRPYVRCLQKMLFGVLVGGLSTDWRSFSECRMEQDNTHP